MSEHRKILIKHIINETKKAFEEERNAMRKLASSDLGISEYIISQLNYCIIKLKKQENQFFTILTREKEITVPLVEELSELLPPNRMQIRYDLERLTNQFEKLRRASGEELARLITYGENACDRDDFDIGLNVINQVLTKDSRNFQALVILAYGTLFYKKNKAEALKLLHRASSNLPLQQTDHYKVFVLLMISLVHELDGNHINAVMTLKRIPYYGLDTPSIHYAIARNYAMGGRAKEAITAITNLVEQHPEFLSHALVDIGFIKISTEFHAFFNQISKQWNEHARVIMTYLDKLEDILKEIDAANDKDLQYFRLNIDESKRLIKCKCLSSSVEFVSNYLPDIFPGFPNKVSKLLGGSTGAREKKILQARMELEEAKYTQKRNLIRKALLYWLGSSVLILLSIHFTGQGSLAALSFWMIYVLIGLVTAALFESRPVVVDDFVDNSSELTDFFKTKSKEIEDIKLGLSEYIKDRTWYS